MKKLLYVGMCLWALLFLFSCDKEDVDGYTPLPKIHLGETFRYQCGEENYTRLEYDTLGQAAVLNFYKDEVTSLDCVDYDENSCTFPFIKGKPDFTVSAGIIHQRIFCGYITDKTECGIG